MRELYYTILGRICSIWTVGDVGRAWSSGLVSKFKGRRIMWDIGCIRCALRDRIDKLVMSEFSSLRSLVKLSSAAS